MNTIDSKSKPALGFLTVVHHPQYGLFGGYLILNTAGRPLEFHCTAPIKPNRAQEILYGPTLESFLYGEQIGQALIGQGGATPLLVCTDKEPALAAREYIATPLVLVLPSEAAERRPPAGWPKQSVAGRLAIRPDAARRTAAGNLPVRQKPPGPARGRRRGPPVGRRAARTRWPSRSTWPSRSSGFGRRSKRPSRQCDEHPLARPTAAGNHQHRPVVRRPPRT